MPKFKNFLEHAVAVERRKTFILDTAKDQGSNLFLGNVQSQF